MMNIRPTSLTFTNQPGFFPPGAPLTGWEVESDSSCFFEVDGNGCLIRKDRISGLRWATGDYTGSFSITNTPLHSRDTYSFLLHIVCGVVKHMAQEKGVPASPLLSLPWRWVLEELIIDQEAVAASKTYKGCLDLLHAAEHDPNFSTGDTKTDLMIAMAHCRPALLQRNSARNALEYLDDHQLRAISSWHRAHPTT